MPVRGLEILEVLFFMKKYKIKSPTGKTFEVLADSIYHACSIVTEHESFKFSNVEYLKLNK